MASSTWALMDEELVEHLTTNNCANAKDWLFFLLETLSHEDFVRATVTVWAIWTARRKAIHEQIFQSPLSIVGFSRSFLADLKLALDVPSNTTVRSRKQNAKAQRQWSAPPPGVCKVNVDAALSKTKFAGAVDAVCRDENGTCSVPRRESLKALKILPLSKHMHVRRVYHLQQILIFRR
jgi:hypothetical protein